MDYEKQIEFWRDGSVKALRSIPFIARYPDEAIPEPDAETAQKLIQEAMEFQRWLLKSLSIS
jgi:hypothetical protein